MNRFEKEIYQCMDPVTQLIQTTDNAHHKAILENFRRHVHLEGSGQYEKIVAPDMMADHPIYRINWGKPSVISGKEEVVEFYRGAGQAVMWNSEDKIAVADWGICDELTFNFLVTGKELENLGIEVDDKEDVYHYKSRQAFIWPYDENAKLVGEHLYVDETSIEVEKVDPVDVITPQRSTEIHLELLQKLDG